MTCGLLTHFRRAVLIEVNPRLDRVCEVIMDREGSRISIHRYDPHQILEESSNVVLPGTWAPNLHNRHYYHVATTDRSYYFYVDSQGNALEFDTQELFDIARMRMRNDPILGQGHQPRIGSTRPDPYRPTRFERLLRENEVWEEFKAPPKPIRETRKQEVTEAELAAIFDKPKKLIADAPKPMDIDIIKCMEEVIGKTR